MAFPENGIGKKCNNQIVDWHDIKHTQIISGCLLLMKSSMIALRSHHVRKIQLCGWNFNIYRTFGDISTCGSGGHIAMSSCLSLSKSVFKLTVVVH